MFTGDFANEYAVNPFLAFAQIECAKNNFYLAETLFKESKAYKWLVKQILENKNNRDLGFGQVSRLLHDALADDPTPYRQQIKNIQVNLYSYLKLYASNDVEIYTPGRKSEVIKLRRKIKMSNSVYTGEANYISQYFYGEENGSSPDFVIPDYQREYSWSDENVRQLFSDVLSGVKSLSCKDLPEIKKEQKSKFLGCIIQWNRKAKENQDFHPSVGNNLYVGSLREIIDGQQRTSTLLVLFVRYYYYFENSIAKLNNSDTESILKNT
ncbi:DUF262 domain-containing protein [Plesiomonas shigelloides subsp. oncorhynchi]|nr:DUF262 domain-containing protein [Plesiomonas shigelloides]